MRPASLNDFSATAISGIIVTRSPSNVGSLASLLRLCGANRSVAMTSQVSSAASNVYREWSAKRGRFVSDSASSHS
jgi:hypothetical protein